MRRPMILASLLFALQTHAQPASDGSVYFTQITRSVGCSDGTGVQRGRIWVVPPGGTNASSATTRR